jgi:hypothetical protein
MESPLKLAAYWQGHPGRWLGRIALALTLTAGSVTDVRAAPPKSDATQAPVCEPPPPPDDPRLTTGRYLNARAEELFAEKDYLAAVKAWEQMLLLMPDQEARLRVQLAHAHLGAYQTEGDAQHLRSARRLFKSLLESLEQDSDQRADIEAELADIDAQLAALAKAERDAQERRDEEIRQKARTELEAQRRDELLRHRAVLRKIHHGVGGGLVSLGLGSLGATAAFLVNGERLDRQGQALATSTGIEDGAYQALLVKGETQNRAAAATAVIGGVLTIVGGTLLVIAAVRYKPDKRRVAVSPAPGGVQLQF